MLDKSSNQERHGRMTWSRGFAPETVRLASDKVLPIALLLRRLLALHRPCQPSRASIEHPEWDRSGAECPHNVKQISIAPRFVRESPEKRSMLTN